MIKYQSKLKFYLQSNLDAHISLFNPYVIIREVRTHSNGVIKTKIESIPICLK